MKTTLNQIARVLNVTLCIAAAAAFFVPNSNGQGITSSGISGAVTDPSGTPFSGVEISVTHEPTGSVYTTQTNANGRFNLRGLRVGGPYTVKAATDGYGDYLREGLFLELSRTTSISINMSDAGEVVELASFTVVADASLQYGASAAGAGSVIGGMGLEETPALNRSFNDIARLDPRVTILDGSVGSGQLVAAGQNNRMNSIQIDGVKINDQFGLGEDGNPSLANPISMDTIDEIAIELSPYDVRQSGFMGASVNAVTKSGTNTFKGSVYHYFEGEDMRGNNPITGQKDVFEEKTTGFTLGGPILQNRLFFFVSYEELTRDVAGPTPGFIPDPDMVEQVRQKMIGDYGFDPGTFGAEGPSTLSDEKIVAKIDWQINDAHRASLRYNITEGEQPSFTEYDDFSSSQPETNLTSHWYTDVRKNESYVFQLFSDWTENFSSEIRIGRSDFDSSPTNPNVFPEIQIHDFPGTTRSGGTTNRGELYLGRDDSRHSNELSTDVENLYIAFDWQLDNHTITFGFDQEESTFFNLFLQETFGEFSYETPDNFFNDIIGFYSDSDPINGSYRFGFDKALGIEGTPIGAFSDFTVTGLFVQDNWVVNDRLSLNFGLRFDETSANNTQPLNPGRNGQSFEEIFGVANTNTIDGSSIVAPRFSFSYDFGNDSNPLQLSGGVGIFNGRNPWVWVSNTFSNNGVSSVDIALPPSGLSRADGGGLLGYLQNDFDPENPVTFVDPSNLDPTARSQVDVLQDGFDLPAITKYNLRAEKKFSAESPWSWWTEGLFSLAKTHLYTVNLNLRETGEISPDGRRLYAGRPDRGNGNTPLYSNVYQLSNTGKGSSTNLSVGVKRYTQDNWWMDASYTWGESKDVSNQGSSTASSNYAGNPIFNQNTAELNNSVYEVKHRFLIRAGYNWEWKPNWTTRFTMVYEGKSGQNYSLLFDNDYNGDGAAFDNDLFWVPSGMDDPLLDVDASSGLEDMFAFLDSIGANPGLAARNSFRTPFRHRIDLNIVQDIPMGDRYKGQVFVNIMNFGNLISSGHGIIDEVPFETLAVAEGSITSDGRIAYDFEGIEPTSIRAGTYSNLSRWRIQTGFKLKF